MDLGRRRVLLSSSRRFSAFATASVSLNTAGMLFVRGRSDTSVYQLDGRRVHDAHRVRRAKWAKSATCCFQGSVDSATTPSDSRKGSATQRMSHSHSTPLNVGSRFNSSILWRMMARSKRPTSIGHGVFVAGACEIDANLSGDSAQAVSLSLSLSSLLARILTRALIASVALSSISAPLLIRDAICARLSPPQREVPSQQSRCASGKEARAATTPVGQQVVAGDEGAVRGRVGGGRAASFGRVVGEQSVRPIRRRGRRSAIERRPCEGSSGRWLFEPSKTNPSRLGGFRQGARAVAVVARANPPARLARLVRLALRCQSRPTSNAATRLHGGQSPLRQRALRRRPSAPTILSSAQNGREFCQQRFVAGKCREFRQKEGREGEMDENR